MDKEAVKNEFLELVDSIEREGFDKDGLIRYLTKKSDFFDAPATSKYSKSYQGGLAEHSLNAYKALCDIVERFSPEEYSPDTLKIVGLLYDISKANFYEEYSRNVKGDDGVWRQVKSYKTREDDDRFIYGSHEQTSEFMVRTFVPLTVEESVAILHHLGGQGFDSTQTNIATVYSRYPLALFLHIADMIDTFVGVIEKKPAEQDESNEGEEPEIGDDAPNE